MKKLRTDNWANVEELNSLLFFAQRLNEMLFDYTLDTFKPRVLNTVILIKEALQTFTDIEDGKIDNNHIEYVIEELNWSYSIDNIAKYILGEESTIFFPIKDSGKKDDLKLRLELLNQKISINSYFNAIKKFITEAVINNEKNKIDESANAFVSLLKNVGFSQGYLFHKTHNFFFNPANQITSLEQINDFLDFFIIEAKNYEVVFKVSKNYEELSDIYTFYRIEKVEADSIESEDEKVNNFISSMTDEQILLSCKKIQHLDLISARRNAYKLLNKLCDYFSFFHHKEKLLISLDCIARSSDESYQYVNQPVSPMKKGNDKIPEKAAKELQKFLKKFDFVPSSIQKIDRAIDLHGISIETPNYENQLLNLWISIEMLIPMSQDKSKIQQITQSLIPFLGSSYNYHILKYTLKGLYNWSYQHAKEAINSVPSEYGENIIERFAAFLSLSEFDEQRNQLYGLLNDYPLLRFRLFKLSELLSSSKNIIKALEVHEKKLRWQIRRIYRTRNLIVHDGKKISYVESLIENGHSYFDNFINTLITLNFDNRQVQSLEQGVKSLELSYSFYKKYIDSMKENEIDKDNYRRMILGDIRHYSQHGI